MRIILRAVFFVLFSAAAWLQFSPCAFAQNPQDMMPAESAAKAKEILQQAIQALGGTAYLNLHDSTCEGRLSQFGHAGELNGFEKFADYTIPPFKDRTENLPKRNIITVMDGDKGWTLDRGGVSEASGADMARFQEDTKKDLDYILRTRMKEPNMIFRYAGPDIVDLKEADWVELVDSDNRTIKIAFSQSTHLPIRKIVDTRDANTRMKTDEVEYYSNYHPSTASRHLSSSPASATTSRFIRSSSISASTTPTSPIRFSPSNRLTSAGRKSAKAPAKKRKKTPRITDAMPCAHPVVVSFR